MLPAANLKAIHRSNSREKIKSMANLKPTFAYTVVYVRDVARSVAFYAKAFGYDVRRLDDSQRWGELESGQTTVAFTPAHQHETDDITGAVHVPTGESRRSPVEVCFDYEDVDAAYKHAMWCFDLQRAVEEAHSGECTIEERMGAEGWVRERHRWDCCTNGKSCFSNLNMKR